MPNTGSNTVMKVHHSASKVALSIGLAYLGSLTCVLLMDQVSMKQAEERGREGVAILLAFFLCPSYIHD